MAENKRTRVAVLGTLAEFHREAIPFDMFALLELVANIDPDLLCLDITPEQWQEQDFNNLPSEYREALLPLARQTDIIVAPIGGDKPTAIREMGGWQGKVIDWLRKWISQIQRTAPEPQAINQGWRHSLANFLYDITRLLSNGDSRFQAQDHAYQLAQQVLEVVRRDPGVRVLVVVNVQYCHLIRKRLLNHDYVEVTSYGHL